MRISHFCQAIDADDALLRSVINAMETELDDSVGKWCQTVYLPIISYYVILNWGTTGRIDTKCLQLFITSSKCSQIFSRA